MKEWTIYLARALSDVPQGCRAGFDEEVQTLRDELRRLGFKFYNFVGLDSTTPPETVTDHDLRCVEAADLVLAIWRYPSGGVAGEITWKCALKEHVLMAAPADVYVTKFLQGFGARNPNFRFTRYHEIIELVPIVVAHFGARKDEPKVMLTAPVHVVDPVTRKPGVTWRSPLVAV